MPHGHGIEHRHDTHAATNRAFALGIALNAAFVSVEAAYGFMSGSTALLADAAHNASDVVGLLVAWGVSVLARQKATSRHTYGLRSATILGALGNGLLLLAVVVGLVWEAIGRLGRPEPVQGFTMLVVAGIGVVVNGASALLFLRGRERDANLRGAFLHLAADAAVSLGVVIAGAIVWRTSLLWVDPATTLGISIVILIGTWGLLKEALHLALGGVPAHVDAAEVKSYLAALPGVCDVHDLHIWAMSTTEVAMTAHLVWPWSERPPEFLGTIEDELRQRFGIDHTTIQLDPLDAARGCPRAAEGAV